MKRSLCLFAMIALGVAGAPNAQAQPGEIGPGEKGATLRLPGMAPERPAAPSDNVLGPWNAGNSVRPGATTTRIAQPPSNEVDINRDIEITAQHGPWVICAMSYSGPDAPKFAREFAIEMRSRFKLNACVYNSGAAEKQKEYQRVNELRKTQMEALQKAGVKGEIMPFRVRTVRIDEQTAVLLAGGYRNRDEALTALKKLRDMKLSPRDVEGLAKNVKLDVKVVLKEEKSAKGGVQISDGEAVYINPFTRAFPAHNPTVKTDETPELDPVDLKLLRKLNEQEPFSLMQVKRPITLAIKQYNTQQILVKTKTEQDSLFSRLSKGLTPKNGEWADQAAINAHDLAEAFRKAGMPETYVLHAKYCSFVTIGGYESLEEPRLKTMQTFLESRFQMEGYRQLSLFARPTPMAVPR